MRGGQVHYIFFEKLETNTMPMENSTLHVPGLKRWNQLLGSYVHEIMAETSERESETEILH